MIQAKQMTSNEAKMINEYLGTNNATKCATDYARDNKQATSKQGYGESMTTAFTPVTIECDEDTPIKDYDITISYVSIGWSNAMLLADKALYRKLMKQDDKFVRVLKRVKKHIKRKARAEANKDNVSKTGVTKRKAYKKRERVVLPSERV